MPRKRKIPIAEEEKENDNNTILPHGPMYSIMSNAQLNETFHKRYVKEMKQLYAKIDHDAFIFTFVKMVKTAMEAEEANEYAHTTLLFCAKFVSSYETEETHRLLVDTCEWLLTTKSNNPHIRFRLCQFVNMILNALGHEAALDDAICDKIMDYMLGRLRDVAPSVRVQAILAMQRLQVPDNPDDPVLRAYQFHLCSDPSPRVRQAVITCMGRNYHTIPYILDRLWDIDEKVRRHTYLHMSSFPVRSYKVSQRLTLLERGLNDRSESVRKVVNSFLLKQWLESYQKDMILLISALKLDSNEEEINRFRKITKQTLKEIFKHQSKDDLTACIPLEEDGEFHRCVLHDKLTIEITIYWQCLTEYLQAEMAEELDSIVPELSTFCAYVERFCHSQSSEMDKFELIEFQYKLLSLMEILYTFDLGDEIGRGNLQKLLAHLLKSFSLDQNVVEVIVKCAENLITDQSIRLQFFVEIIQDICDLNAKQNDLLHDRNLISELMAGSSDADLNLKLSSLKVKILDLEEQEMNLVQTKNYVKAQEITDEKNAATREYMNLLQPLLDARGGGAESSTPTLRLTNVVNNASILKGLQITFYMLMSAKVNSLNPSVCNLYKDFICRHIASNQIAIRDWALKCGTTYSMLYETLAKDVFNELFSQFSKNSNIRIWETAITCIFELLDRYGVDNFVVQEQQNKSKKTGRQLYNTLENLDAEEESAGQGVDVIYTMSHFLGTCEDVCITRAIINGFCRLVLRGYVKNNDIIEKLLLRYFTPTTDNEINQMLGIFLERLIQRKKLHLLHPCLLPLVTTVLTAPYDSPLHEIRPETVTRFIIDSTRQEVSPSSGNIHNKMAETFLQEMLNNVTNKELCKLLAKEILTLELSVVQQEKLKNEMKDMADKLIKSEFDPKTIRNMIDFKTMLDGGTLKKTLTADDDNESEGESKSDDETVATTEDVQCVANVVSTTGDEVPLAVSENPSEAPISTTLVPNPEDDTNPTVGADASQESIIQSATPPSAASANISPPAAVPTTFGRDNRVGHRYLRKSLNASRSQSDTEAGDGPSRPSKIRIEARIDSEKKSTQTPEPKRNKINPPAAKRNLRYATRRNANAETASAPSTESPRTQSRLRNDGEQIQIMDLSKNAPNSPRSLRNKSPQKGSPARMERSNPNSNTSHPKRMATEQQSEREESTAGSEDLNSSDFIPSSPTGESTRLPYTRLRRGLASSTGTQQTSSDRSSSTITTRKAIGKINSTTQKPPSKDGTAAVVGASTPLRNGRKRVLRVSPKVASVALHADPSNSSPLRKQLRSDRGTEAVTGNEKSKLAANHQPDTSSTEVALNRSGSRSAGKTNASHAVMTIASDTDDGVTEASSQQSAVSNQNHSRKERGAVLNTSEPASDDQPIKSSTKMSPSRALSGATNKSVSSRVVSAMSIASDTDDGDVEMSSQSDSHHRRRTGNGKGPVTASSATSATSASLITTRNGSRREDLSKMIMTRKRSLTNANSGPGVVKSSQRKSKAPSKIPVRTVPSKKASTTTGTASSSSSSTEDTSSTKSGSPRRRMLTSQVARINLTLSRNGPARPTRAKTSTTDVRSSSSSSSSRVTRRRNI